MGQKFSNTLSFSFLDSEGSILISRFHIDLNPFLPFWEEGPSSNVAEVSNKSFGTGRQCLLGENNPIEELEESFKFTHLGRVLK